MRQRVIPDQTPLRRAAAADYYEKRGCVCMPLQNDSNGYPERPIVPGWTNISACMADIDALPRQGATGLGILLGPTSNNLAVLDIESQTLGR